jgi:hypothetical protein
VKDIQIYDNLEEDDRILFDKRAKPLKVIAIEDDQIKIKGPSGGEYILFKAEEKQRVLTSKEDSRDYASYVENLREIGEWEKTDETTWKHSKSDAKFTIEKKKTGFWTIKSDDFNLREEIDLPLYGYSAKEFAIKDIQKFINKHPEG